MKKYTLVLIGLLCCAVSLQAKKGRGVDNFEMLARQAINDALRNIGKPNERTFSFVFEIFNNDINMPRVWKTPALSEDAQKIFKYLKSNRCRGIEKNID